MKTIWLSGYLSARLLESIVFFLKQQMVIFSSHCLGRILSSQAQDKDTCSFRRKWNCRYSRSKIMIINFSPNVNYSSVGLTHSGIHLVHRTQLRAHHHPALDAPSQGMCEGIDCWETRGVDRQWNSGCCCILLAFVVWGFCLFILLS